MRTRLAWVGLHEARGYAADNWRASHRPTARVHHLVVIVVVVMLLKVLVVLVVLMVHRHAHLVVHLVVVVLLRVSIMELVLLIQLVLLLVHHVRMLRLHERLLLVDRWGRVLHGRRLVLLAACRLLLLRGRLKTHQGGRGGAAAIGRQVAGAVRGRLLLLDRRCR